MASDSGHASIATLLCSEEEGPASISTLLRDSLRLVSFISFEVVLTFSLNLITNFVSSLNYLQLEGVLSLVRKGT